MSLQLAIDYPCRVKKELGHGDLRAGTITLLEQVNLPTPTHETPTLAPHQAACANCPVNALRLPFGCLHILPFPIRPAVEKFLLTRLQPQTTIGGAVRAESFAELGITGERLRELRTRGVFQAFPAPRYEVAPGDAVDSDQLFEAMLPTNGRLVPWQSLNILLWLGAVKIDERIPVSAEDAFTLTRLEPVDRARRAKLAFGVHDPDPMAEAARTLLKILFVAWVRDVPVVVDGIAVDSST
jgi:hypothetical protein